MRARKFTKVDIDAPSSTSTATATATGSRRQTPARRYGKRTCCIIFLYGLIRLYYAIEMRIQDPYLKALLYSPLRTFHIRYLDVVPANRKTFRATANNTFVINLESDITRRKSFEKHNNNKLWRYQFFPATTWVPFVENEEDANATATAAYENQQKYAQEYVFVAKKSKIGHFGDAASTMSHIRLMEQLLESKHEDYYIIFEDDVLVRDPLKSSGLIQAPSDAHVVFLVNYATKLTRVPKKEVRVIQGYGAQGYVVTKAGATRILQYLSHNFAPFDCAMAGDAKGLRVYLPQNWPLVRHAPGSKGSSRRAFNAKKVN